MTKPFSVLVAISIIAFARIPSVTCQTDQVSRGTWGAFARSLSSQDGSPSSLGVVSPNGVLVITEAADGVRFVDPKGSTTLLDDVPSGSPLTEVLWSPTSKSFAVTASDGGLVGTWDAFAYSIDGNQHLAVHNIRDVIASSIVGFPQCLTPEKAGVAAVTWLKDGAELLVVSEVPPHSSCRNMGAIRGFLISAKDWRILEQIPAGTLRSAWRTDLGARLLNSR